MTQSASRKVKNISATEEALSDASRLLSRLCKSRKAGMRLQEIIDLTGKVASLSRSLHHHDLDQKRSEGYGDQNHYAGISEVHNRSNLIR
jgi:hypothetical protein